MTQAAVFTTTDGRKLAVDPHHVESVSEVTFNEDPDEVVRDQVSLRFASGRHERVSSSFGDAMRTLAAAAGAEASGVSCGQAEVPTGIELTEEEAEDFLRWQGGLVPPALREARAELPGVDCDVVLVHPVRVRGVSKVQDLDAPFGYLPDRAAIRMLDGSEVQVACGVDEAARLLSEAAREARAVLARGSAGR